MHATGGKWMQLVTNLSGLECLDLTVEHDHVEVQIGDVRMFLLESGVPSFRLGAQFIQGHLLWGTYEHDYATKWIKNLNLFSIITLTSLDLSDNRLGMQGIDALASSLENRGISHLGLNSTFSGLSEAISLIKALNRSAEPRIVVLEIEKNSIPLAAPDFIDSLKGVTSLKKLSLAGNSLSVGDHREDGAHDLSNNGSFEATLPFWDHLRDLGIQELSVAKCHVTADAVKALGSLEWPTLEVFLLRFWVLPHPPPP